MRFVCFGTKFAPPRLRCDGLGTRFAVAGLRSVSFGTKFTPLRLRFFCLGTRFAILKLKSPGLKSVNLLRLS
jgi:hypothetical protein